MPFQVSPGVNVSEVDLTTTTPAAAVSVGALVGQFAKGPVGEIVTVSSETELAQVFGKPTDQNYRSFYTAANFLAYAGNLQVSRVAGSGTLNAVAGISSSSSPAARSADAMTGSAGGTQSHKGLTGSVDTFTIQETLFGGTVTATLDTGSGASAVTNFVVSSDETQIIFDTAPTGDLSITVPARTIFTLTGATIESGDTVTVTVGGVDQSVGVDFTVSGNSVVFESGSVPADSAAVAVSLQGPATTSFTYNPVMIGTASDVSFGSAQAGGAEFAARSPGPHGNFLKVYMVDSGTFSELPSTLQNEFSGAPSVGELHVVVCSSESGTDKVIEKFSFLSKASDGKLEDGTNIYYVDYVNEFSSYIFAINHTSEGTNWGTPSQGTTFTTLSSAVYLEFSGGTEGSVPTAGEAISGYSVFEDSETTDVSLILSGEWGDITNGNTVQTHIIDTVAAGRRDAVALISARYVDCVGSSPAADVISYFTTTMTSNSNYAFVDSNYKYQYDKYNDKYRWVPLNGDIAGLMARTDTERDPWFSPAGFNRGIIKNVVKTAWTQTKASRDDLYRKALNPVVTFPGQGTVLYGDKTFVTKPSAFDRINVRRLFIVLEKTIATASKFTLFEMNDEFTRSQFVSLVEPFLREVKGRRGIFDFLVVCDSTNNTAQVVDSNEFVGDIFIKPARSINFIQLNFVATRTGTDFEEIVGSV